MPHGKEIHVFRAPTQARYGELLDLFERELPQREQRSFLLTKLVRKVFVGLEICEKQTTIGEEML